MAWSFLSVLFHNFDPNLVPVSDGFQHPGIAFEFAQQIHFRDEAAFVAL
jgi:hypothetical protein